MQTQVELEQETYSFGRSKAARNLETNEDKGRANNNPYAQAVYRRFVLPLAEIIKEDLETKKAGRHRAHIELLRPLDPEAAAFLAVREALVLLLDGRNDNGRQIITAIGRSVYHEYILNRFSEAEPDLFYYMVNEFDRRLSKSERHRMTVFKMEARRKGIHWQEWTNGSRDQVGAYLLEQLEALGMLDIKVQTVKTPAKGHKQHTIAFLTEETATLISSIKEFVIESTPYFLPCVEPPKDWVAVNDGGFHTREMRRMMPWAVKCHPSMRDHYAEADMSQELSALNTLQHVRWRINGDMVDAIKLVAKHFDMDEIISQAEQPKPPKPYWLTPDLKKEDMDDDQLKEFAHWRREIAEWHTDRKIRGTKAGRFYTALRVAGKFRPYPEIFFVYFEDFRGRKYVQTTGVSPQGSDLQKSLLEFAEGKPLTDREAEEWFKIAGANRWGYDKASLSDRAAWVDERKQLLLSFAEDPISNSEWMEADSPLQFLAWCLEYRAWCANPSTYESRLAVGMDGSCNGLQNFSAMLRDSLGGKATNLVPSSLPNDIYQMVAEVTLRLLKAAEADEQGYRARWLKHGMNRTLVKRSVMTLPYGSTRYSCAEFIVQDYLRSGKVPEFEKAEYARAANYLSHFVWQAIGEVVVKAREAMGWLQSAARTLVKGKVQTLGWTTPSGFPVAQAYYELEAHRIRTHLHGGIRLLVHSEVKKADVRRHKNGIAPNFVHSLDASHLTLTVNASKAAGIESLAMIHDDYGTHAADAGKLYRIIREEFVRMYTEHDPLEEFRERYPNLPDPPARGTLDINQVLESKYFFS